MKKFALALTLALSLMFTQTAQAWTVPDYGWLWFTGNTLELKKIRAAINKLGGYPETSWTPPYDQTYGVLQPPFGMGSVDCMDAHYWPDQGPYDGAEDYLGLSVQLGEEIVEIPALEDLVDVHTMPGECYGYMYYMWCVETGFGDMVCPDP